MKIGSMQSRWPVFTAGLLMLTAGGAGAQSLVNAGFDSDLSGWANPFARPASWDPLDASGQSDSGSVRIGAQPPGNNAVVLVLDQCVPTTAVGAMVFGATVRVLPGQPQWVAPRIAASTYASGDCSGTPVASGFDDDFSLATEWTAIDGEIPVDPAVQSVRVTLGVLNPAGTTDTVFVQIDDVFLLDEYIFADDFELP